MNLPAVHCPSCGEVMPRHLDDCARGSAPTEPPASRETVEAAELVERERHESFERALAMVDLLDDLYALCERHGFAAVEEALDAMRTR